MEREKYIPLGSVVRLKDASALVMVTGYAAIDEDEATKIYDYVGCQYPEGIVDQDEMLLFDHSQIAEILYIGYESEEYNKYIKEVEETVKNYENSQMIETSTNVLNTKSTNADSRIKSEIDLNYEQLG